MAVYRRKNSGNYFAQFNVNGKTHIRSTRTSDKELAKKIEERWKKGLRENDVVGNPPEVFWNKANIAFIPPKPVKNPFQQKRMWMSAKTRAKKKNLPFTITPEDIYLPVYCPILNIKLKYPPHIKGISTQDPALPSLDRIDNTRGYVPDNIQVISLRANRIKCDGTYEELYKIALYVKSLT